MQEDMTNALINIPSLTNFVKSIVKEAVEEDKKDLTGKTWNIKQFRETCCRGKGEFYI